MTIDLDGAARFLATHGRVLDRRRFEAIVSGSEAARAAIVGGLEPYRNADGGYGWGLEPDFRAAESQPQGAQHVLEALVESGAAAAPRARPVLDWLQSVTRPDGGLPFALPVQHRDGCAPFFLGPDAGESSLQATSINAAHAYRLARHDRSLLDHPWLSTATRYCFAAIEQLRESPMGYVLSYSLRFLDAASDTRPEAAGLLAQLAQFIPPDGAIPVPGGRAGEVIRPLEFSAEPERPLREHVDPAAISDDLDRTEAGQQPDGGWEVDFDSYSPAAALEWRGTATVNAVATLRRNGRC